MQLKSKFKSNHAKPNHNVQIAGLYCYDHPLIYIKPVLSVYT